MIEAHYSAAEDQAERPLSHICCVIVGVNTLIKVRYERSFFSLTDRKCNPSLLGIIGLNSTSATEQDHVVQWWDAQGIVGLVLFLLCVLYSRYTCVFPRLLCSCDLMVPSSWLMTKLCA